MVAVAIRNLTVPVGLLLSQVCATIAAAQGSAVIVGVVIDAGSSSSIPDATVEIAELSLATRTNARGSFSFQQLAPGNYTLSVRAIGFARFRTTVRVVDQPRVEVPVSLPRVTALDTMLVTSIAEEPLAFIEARSLGLGSFVSAKELAASGDRRLTDILTTVRSVGVIQGRGGRGYVYSRHKPPSLRPAPIMRADGTRNRLGDDVYYPEKGDDALGIVPACYARVYLNKQLLNAGSPAEPVNINQYSPRDLVGIEFYAGPASLPAHLSNLNATCGVIVLRTRY